MSIGTSSDAERAAVLVVDDEPANLMAMSVALEGLDVDMVTAACGEEALRAVLRENIAIVLLDIGLPDLDGFAVAELIRKRDSGRHLPIIFVTARDQNPAEIRRGYALGAVDFVFKPFAVELVRAKVQIFVQLRAKTRMVAQLEREAAARRLEEARREWESAALREQVEAQRRVSAALEAADRRKDEFLAVLAHELRNPLAPVLTGLELVRMQTEGVDSVGRTCDAMQRQVMHLVRLIDDLLDVSRIARGKVQLQLEPVDVRKCIEQAVETHLAAADEAGHRLHVTLPDHPLVCMADPVRVIQIVSNLIANSVRYTPPGGDIHVSALSERGRVLIRVRDNGVGISPELLPRIFDTFVQERIGDAGLGLGLTLVKQVATLHNGIVAVRSEGKGLGSEFEVSLPERIANVESRERTAATTEGASVPLRVLVVEDQVDISAMTQDLLQGWGHEVHVAYTGFDGVALARALRPDVVLLDIGLPDIDGFAVANQIRAGLGRASARLVAVTGFGNADYRARAREAGFDDYLVKPAPPAALRLAVERGS